MKKVSLLILLVIVASLLVAAIPTKMVRLTVINKSGSDVYIKLEGSALTEAYYYLTIPAGDRDEPTVKVFTIMEDVYTRTTWMCEVFEAEGSLFVDGNMRLTFTPCGETSGCTFCGFWDDCVPWEFRTGCRRGDWAVFWNVKRINAGEPRMEKIAYFKVLYGPYSPVWANAYLYDGYWAFGCALKYWRIRSWYTPVGCEWRYQY